MLKPLVLEACREDFRRTPYDLRDSRIIAYLIALLSNELTEHFHVLFLDVYRCVIREERIASGGWNQVDVRVRDVLRRAIDHNAANLVLAHNHPSGIPTPSDDDLALTRHAKEAASVLGIAVVDHLIVAGSKVFSMEKAGLL